MSFLDKTDGNMTVAPLYAEIDGLHDRVKQYQALLQVANEEVDDKLQKLGRAGNDSVEITKELSEARKQIRKLEDRLRDSGSKDEVQRLSQQLRETEAVSAIHRTPDRRGEADNGNLPRPLGL